MARNYTQIEEGEWVSVPLKTTEICCDCGLTHDVQYRVRGRGEIEFRVTRNARRTAAFRREMKGILHPVRKERIKR
jgi:hypothetical protein